jgi:hypothetical protein
MNNRRAWFMYRAMQAKVDRRDKRINELVKTLKYIRKVYTPNDNLVNYITDAL